MTKLQMKLSAQNCSIVVNSKLEMTSTVKPHKAIEKLDENVRYCLWALISAPFEDQLKEMTTISKDVLGKLLCRGRLSNT